MSKLNPVSDAKRWLCGEISLGKLIELSGLLHCYAQAADLVGGIANAFDEQLQAAAERNKALADQVDRLQTNLRADTAAMAELRVKIADASLKGIDALAKVCRLRAENEMLKREIAKNNETAQTWDRLSLESEIAELRKACSRTLQYLRQPDDCEAEYIERILSQAIDEAKERPAA